MVKYITFKVNGKLVQNFTVLATAGNHSIVMDESKELKGDDFGMNPIETFLSALAGCFLITLRFTAASMNVDISEANAELEGEIDPRGFMGVEGVYAGLQNVKLKLTVKSSSTEEKIRSLLELVENRCPVNSTLKKGINVEVTFEKTP